VSGGLNTGSVDARASSDAVRYRKSLSLPGFELLFSGRSASNIVIVLTELSRLINYYGR
jgi:hypothetical protein